MTVAKATILELHRSASFTPLEDGPTLQPEDSTADHGTQNNWLCSAERFSNGSATANEHDAASEHVGRSHWLSSPQKGPNTTVRARVDGCPVAGSAHRAVRRPLNVTDKCQNLTGLLMPLAGREGGRALQLDLPAANWRRRQSVQRQKYGTAAVASN